MKTTCAFLTFIAVAQLCNGQILNKVEAIQDDLHDLYLKLTAVPLDTMHQIAKLSGSAVSGVLSDIDNHFSDPTLVQRLREREANIPAFQVGSNKLNIKPVAPPKTEEVLTSLAKECAKKVGLDDSQLSKPLGRSTRNQLLTKVNLVCIMKHLEWNSRN